MELIKNKLVFIVEDNDLYSLMLGYSLSNDNKVRSVCFKTEEECIEMNPYDYHTGITGCLISMERKHLNG
jgi:hypothetical protein